MTAIARGGASWTGNPNRIYALVTVCAGALANPAWAVSVSLTSPNNSIVTAPATITLSATATPGAGRRILRVDFFRGTTRIGTDTSSPYGIVWSNVPAGTYVLTATAIDNGGSIAVSSPVVIRVDHPPRVSLTSPSADAVFASGSNVALVAAAEDSDEIVAKVEFFAGEMLIGREFFAPYNVRWNNVPAGRYSLTARATDLLGLVTTSAPVTIVVDDAPTVAIISPAARAVFTAPATLTVTATAADSDGVVTQVEFFDGPTLVSTVPSTPGNSSYSVTLTNLAVGTHALSARATDDLGFASRSLAVTVTVNSAVAQMYYVHTDHLNTPRLIADAAGTTIWRWDQGEPFGDDAPNNNPSRAEAFEFPLRFPGQYFDSELRTHYNRFRDYDPSLGRYTQSDIISLKGGLNTYSYALQNPNQYVDILGLDVNFCYYSNLPTHIGFGVVGEDARTQGYYPRLPKAPLSPGIVKPDPNPFDEPRECKTVASTPAQDKCMLDCRERRRNYPGWYNAVTRQCTDFVRDCALECKVPVGTNGSPVPKWFYGGIPASGFPE
jgi:RHS repeat-associated protein